MSKIIGIKIEDSQGFCFVKNFLLQKYRIPRQQKRALSQEILPKEDPPPQHFPEPPRRKLPPIVTIILPRNETQK